MSEDLNRLLKAQIEKDVRQRPRPDLASVMRRGLRRRELTRMAASVAVVIAVAGAVPAARYIVNDSPSVGPAGERNHVETEPTPGRWRPIGQPEFQPVPSKSRGTVRVSTSLGWEGPIEGSTPTECEVRVLDAEGRVLGAVTATIQPTEKTFPDGAVPGHELSVRVPLESTNRMGVDSTVHCAPAASEDRGGERNN